MYGVYEKSIQTFRTPEVKKALARLGLKLDDNIRRSSGKN
jgi:hypothetical protein